MSIKDISIGDSSGIRDTLLYVGSMVGVESVSHADVPHTVKYIVQGVITVAYLTYASIQLVKKIKELKEKDKNND